jgi:hypothetical protein
MNHRQQLEIEYLLEEIRVLHEQLGKRPRFNDDQGEKAQAAIPYLMQLLDDPDEQARRTARAALSVIEEKAPKPN